MEELINIIFDSDLPTLLAGFPTNRYEVLSKPKIEKVIFNNPATIIKWCDGTKTVVKCDEHDTYDPEKGLLIAILKKFFGNKGSFYKDIVVPWLPKETEE